MPVTRRQFLRYAGAGAAALLARPPRAPGDAAFPLKRRKGAPPGFFKPIAPSAADRLEVPEGYEVHVVCAWGDPLGRTHAEYGPERFGFNCDFNAFFPLDALTANVAKDEGLLWTNHEYPDPLFVGGYQGRGAKTAEQVRLEKLCVGGTVLHVKRQDGRWKPVAGSKYTRRLTALYPMIEVSGPAKEEVPRGLGTLANCSGGKTPWHTVLTCEENFQDCNARDGYGLRWGDAPGAAISEQGYGWVVEVDPFDVLPPRKLSALGRFAHENCTWRLGGGNQLVVYMGDDSADQHLYKYVSAEAYDEKATREQKRELLTKGTLYAADMLRGRWLPLDLETNPELRRAGFPSQAEVLIHAREAAKALRATPLDRPEDCEIHPADGALFVALTNGKAHGNFFGQVIRLVEKGDRAEATEFRYEVFLAGGPQSGLACPDNLAFDKKGNLWVACDISTELVRRGTMEPFGNNGFFVVPTAGESAGDAFQFASGPVGAELTGPWFTDDYTTMFLSVQHPGEDSRPGEKPTSHWPDGGDKVPRPAVVAITGPFLGR